MMGRGADTGEHSRRKREIQGSTDLDTGSTVRAWDDQAHVGRAAALDFACSVLCMAIRLVDSWFLRVSRVC